MTTRRTFLNILGSLVALPAAASLSGCARDPRMREGGATAPSDFAEKIGVQLYSFRNELGDDLEGTLRAVREAGFTDVETYSFHNRTPADFRRLLDDNGLHASGMHVQFDRLTGDLAPLVADARTLGVTYVTNPWIPHEAPYDEEDLARTVSTFMNAGRVLRDEGFRFTYHIHGYEFQPADDGETLFDRLMEQTEPGIVDIQMDVFWVVWPGQDPVSLIEKYPGRFPQFHLKDMRRGTQTGDLSGGAPHDLQVPLGEGMIDIAGIVSAGEAQGGDRYYIEYEHEDPIEAARESLDYLENLRA